MMKSFCLCLLLPVIVLLFTTAAHGQSTFVNPVIPGDHPDPTLTRIGDDYYTSGSSFNVTPKIYHSTDLVHWEVIAQPVAADWGSYGDVPAGGIWGGHMVYHGDQYWHFFGRGTGDRAMYFVTSNQPAGPWGTPVRMTVPGGVPGFGVDNSIFVDDDDRWFLLTKNGRSGNYVVELGHDGQADGAVYDLTWLNPSADGYPYSWAEGPVMWKHEGYYYYSFAQHLAGNQYVMKSSVQGAPLSGDPAAWETPRIMFEGRQGSFRTPNHSSPAVTTANGTSWVISQSYDFGEWQALGRQGILSQIVYDADGWPLAEYPSGVEEAPDLPSSGIPWTVPRSDMFDEPEMAPDWSFLGFTPDNSHSLTDRPGWLRLAPYGGNRLFPGQNTVIQNAPEHAYSLLTRVEFTPVGTRDEAGLWTFNGPEALETRLSVVHDGSDARSVMFGFDETVYSAPLDSAAGAVWLRLQREGHDLKGSYSLNGVDWMFAGEAINVSRMDREQPKSESGYDFNAFTGNQQGLYVRGDTPADFDLYVYRDAYSSIPAWYPSSYDGVMPSSSGYLNGVGNGDWAMYAGVEFGDSPAGEAVNDYPHTARTVEVVASSATAGGTIEVRLDSLDGHKIAEVRVDSTGTWNNYLAFSAQVAPVGGRHDVFLLGTGTGSGQLLRIKQFQFTSILTTSVTMEIVPRVPALGQNYPNPFGFDGVETTIIEYAVQTPGHVTLSVYNVLGQEVATLVDNFEPAGRHSVMFDGRGLPDGAYFYRLESGAQTGVATMILVR